VRVRLVLLVRLAHHEEAPVSGAGIEITAARWRVPLEREISVLAVIGPEGGTLELPETGLRLIVPADAVDAPTHFRVTARAGRIAAYDFEPDGSTFAPALRVEQDPARLEPPPPRGDRPARMQLGYYEDPNVIDEARSVATVAEVHQGIDGAESAFAVPHFSDYVVGWGAK
jgi:hypothetical protein